MKDINDNEIKIGDYVKRYGLVKYADGLKPKISKKTWIVSKIENDELFYESRFLDWKGEEVVEDVRLPRPSKEGGFLVIGDENGLKDEFISPETLKIDVGTVAGVYRVLKDIKEQNWKAGEIVKIHGKISFETLEQGFLEKVADSVKHQHVLVVVDTIIMNKNIN